MFSLMRRTIDTLLPKGSAWSPKPGGGFDKFLNGLAANWETIRLFLSDLKNIRNPSKTSFLDDLEREYGVLTNLSLTEEQRRAALNPLVYNNDSTGSADALQDALQRAGFDVQIHENSPAVDPAIFLDQVFQMVAGGGAAFAGNQNAFAGRIGGELLVNGEIFKNTRMYESVAGTMFAGTAGAGEYTDLERTKVEYPIPNDPNDWPLIFFVGGDATRNIDGELTAIENADIPTEQESIFKQIVLKFKPMHTWAGLIVTYI